MIISKDLEFIREYIELVKHLLPSYKKLKRVTIRKASKTNMQHSNGMITKYFDKAHYRITLFTNFANVESYKPLKIKLYNFSTLDILVHLAHELAHMEHWYHTPEHKHLECIIMGMFATRLKENGYTSEEDEMKVIGKEYKTE